MELALSLPVEALLELVTVLAPFAITLEWSSCFHGFLLKIKPRDRLMSWKSRG